MNRPTTENVQSLSDWMRHHTNGITSWLGKRLHQLGIHPDAITVTGWLLVVIGTIFIAQGEFLVGGLWLLVALPMDALDGAVARAMARTDDFGAFLDSTLDRYADGFIFVAFSYHFAMTSRFDLFVLTQLALIGSFLVSYSRARAEGLGLECKVGLFTRMERLAIIFMMLFIPLTLTVGIWLLAIGTQLTAIQRIWYVYQTLKNRGE